MTQLDVRPLPVAASFQAAAVPEALGFVDEAVVAAMIADREPSTPVRMLAVGGVDRLVFQSMPAQRGMLFAR